MTWQAAIQSASEGLKDICLKYMSDNFCNAIFTPLLYTLQFSSFMSLLQRLQVGSGIEEENKFLLIASWIEADQINREVHISDILTTIVIENLKHEFIIDQMSAKVGLAKYPAAR